MGSSGVRRLPGEWIRLLNETKELHQLSVHLCWQQEKEGRAPGNSPHAAIGPSTEQNSCWKMDSRDTSSRLDRFRWEPIQSIRVKQNADVDMID